MTQNRYMKHSFSNKPAHTIRNTAFVFLFLFSFTAFGQIKNSISYGNLKKELLTPEQYKQKKAAGLLDAKVEYIVNSPIKSGNIKPSKPKSAKSSRDLNSPPCGYVPTTNFQDPWGGQVNFDDFPPGGEFEVPLPFAFCFYDQQFNSFFINNNGNITFDAQYTTFTSQGFPTAAVPPMIAPFWGDVDTGDESGPLGQVRYEVYPDYAIVSWDSVGVYPGSDQNQRNTFQLIITDGISPVLPPQTNICFIYGDMQWTTGTASGGTGGFGGTPATVGVNRGDGLGYIQLGQFDAPGTSYDGPFGANDGVDFLDNTIFFFNTCLEPGVKNNIAPISIGAPICDTLVICAGGTIPIDFNFIPVEPGQTVNAELLTTELAGVTINSITAGAQCSVSASFTPDQDAQGYQTISFLATDDGTPAASYQLDIVFNILESNFVPVVTGVFALCDGDAAELSVGGGIFDSYNWLPGGQTTPTIQVSDTGLVSVTVSAGTCFGSSEPVFISVAENPTPIITGQDSVCNDGLTSLITTIPYAQYSWENTTTNLGANDTINVPAGIYSVTVTDVNGCTGTAAQFEVISVSSLVPDVIGDSIICFDETAAITTSETFSTYEWTNTSTNPPTIVGSTQSVVIGPGTYTVFITDTILGCDGTSLAFEVNQYEPNITLEGIEPFCNDTSIVIIETNNYAFYSWFYQGVEISDSSAIIWSGDNGVDSLVLTITDIHGCSEVTTVDAPYTLPPVPNYSTNPPVPETLENTTVQFTDASIPSTNDPIVEWLWTFDPPNASSTQQNPSQAFNTTDSVTVTLIVVSELGCRDTLISSITAPFVPNAFSPNGDGKNDVFKIPFITNLKENNVVVFNRWGKKVFEADNYANTWDGENLPSGTYFYVVSAPNFKTMQGAVSIFRE
jgi:gliding motility-associated-like protein